MREMLSKARDPEYATRIMGLITECNTMNVANNRLHHWLPMENCISVNNLCRSVYTFRASLLIRLFRYSNVENIFRI